MKENMNSIPSSSFGATCQINEKGAVKNEKPNRSKWCNQSPPF